MIGSLGSVLKTVAVIAIELHQYGCNLLCYGWSKAGPFRNLSQHAVGLNIGV